ncbi:MAG: serine/threonine protein phosphatase [Atopobiaceae bacterium]|nr:serine/threonine protein phosphatase [Atopobiaceae bacterium]
MATYVFSDVHGHFGTLDRLLERVSPTSDDRIFMLGDMIDRGPDPISVVRCCYQLPNTTVLMGNHEDLMLSYYSDPDDTMARVNWLINGGETTQEGLRSLPVDERIELARWLFTLPLYAQAEVGGRRYLLVHAGIDPRRIPSKDVAEWDEIAIDEVVADQYRDDLMWIREDFWSVPTGLVNEKGEGPIVIAGHTPTLYLEHMADLPDRPAKNARGLCQMVRVGACEQTGGVADRWDIDCGCAGGAGFGQLLMLRLDDGEEIYEPVREGE